MENLNETILKSWLRLSLSVNNERLVSDLPYNESLIYHILYYSYLKNPEQAITATDLCRAIRMKKSQMNRTLTNMEKNGWIVRERSSEDKRQIFVHINLDNIDVYQKQHDRILHLIDELIKKIGKEKAEEANRLFTEIADAAETVIK